MSDIPCIFTLDPKSHQLRPCRDSEVSRTVHDGTTYITTTDIQVFVSHPLLNLRTGGKEELWLTKDQHELYRRAGHQEIKHELDLHPRLFDLPEIGLPPERREGVIDDKAIEGHLRPGHVIGLTQDNGGHWWEGRGNFGYVMAYRTNPILKGKWHEPEVRFLRPWLRHISDDDMVMYSRTSQRDAAEVQLTLCNRKVAEAINDLGMWGHYFPDGKARTSVTAARKEASALRKKQVGQIKAATKDKLVSLKETAEKATDILDRVRKELVETQEGWKKDQGVIASLERKYAAQAAELLAAQNRLAELEDDLNPNRPFDLDRV